MQTAAHRLRDRERERRIVVPPTPEGLATALTHLGVARRPPTLDRGEDAGSRRPPSIGLGSEVRIPDELREATPKTGIEFHLPRRLDAGFVVAPLAFYLGADVEIVDHDTPRLALPERNRVHSLPGLPDLQDAAAGLLRRVVTLDGLIHEPGAENGGLLDAIDVSPARLREATLEERVDRYLDVSFERVGGRLPEWNLAMYVDPSPDHLPVLPHLLDRLCAIYLPEGSPIEREELIERSLADFYRGHPDLDVEVVSPDRPRGQVRGWLADGVAIDAFKATPTAFENRASIEARDERKRVTVVLNEPDMDEEGEIVERVYRDRAAALGVDVSVHRRLDREELEGVLGEPTSFLHYVGHCDDAGLRCADGNLAIEEIEASGARTFLLNACGSYREGRALLRKGSVAGAVTLRPVIDGQAARVGTAFAQLVMCGFCIERALRIARRRAIINKDYVAVGDGTYALRCCEGVEARIETHSEDRFRLVLEGTGAASGEELAVTVTRSELLAYLARADVPVEYQGRRQHATDLHRDILDAGRSRDREIDG